MTVVGLALFIAASCLLQRSGAAAAAAAAAGLAGERWLQLCAFRGWTSSLHFWVLHMPTLARRPRQLPISPGLAAAAGGAGAAGRQQVESPGRAEASSAARQTHGCLVARWKHAGQQSQEQGPP